MIEGESNRQFDPEVVAAFRRALPRVLEVLERHRPVDAESPREVPNAPTYADLEVV
jgi:HD-GYP domain-containing protein (c-di-GMP phosphodiesterase class II)